MCRSDVNGIASLSLIAPRLQPEYRLAAQSGYSTHTSRWAKPAGKFEKPGKPGS